MSNVENEITYTWQHFCKDFVSLHWLDGSINFVFRFVAKVSELLLAIGIVISAVDYLTHGRLMQNNLALANAWALTQAIAIESSSGVVLLYALQARKEQDHVKMWLYATLAGMLAVVGGVMLYTQIVYSSTGVDLALQTPMQIAVLIAIARTVVSIAYIGMCRIKHVRLSGKEDEAKSEDMSPIDIKSLVDEAVGTAITNALQQLQDMQKRQFDIAIQEVKRTVIEEVTQQHLIAIPKEATSKTAKPPSKVVDSKPSNIDRLTIAKNALIANPTIKDKELADLLQCSSINTARNWKHKALAQLPAVNVEHVPATNGHQ